MKEIWERFEAWIDRYANLLLDDLNGGAEEEHFEPIERAIRSELPQAFKEFYRIHDGQYSESEEGLIDTHILLPLEQMLSIWAQLRHQFDEGAFDDLESEPQDGIRMEWWNPYWLPLTTDKAGSFIFMDFAPSRQGNLGQIIYMPRDSAERILLAPSFEAWISRYVRHLEEGHYRYSERMGGIIQKQRLNGVSDDSQHSFWHDSENDDLEGFEVVREE